MSFNKIILIWILLQIGPLGALFAQGNWEYFTTDNSILVDNTINDILVVDNIKWIGTSWGLYSFDNASWIDYTSELPHPKVNSINMDNEGKLYVSTLGGLAIFNGDNWEVLTPQNSILPSHINEIVFDNSNIAYVGTINGLYQINDGVISNILDSSSLEPTFVNVRCLAIKGDSLCVGTINGGLGYLYNDSINWYNSDNGLIDNTATDLLVMDNNLWISTPYGGLLSQLSTASFLIFNTTYFENWPSNSLNTLFKSDDNVLYVGSSGAGFFIFSYEAGIQNTTVFNSENSGLINDVVLSIEKEGDSFWIGTEGGLIKLSNVSNIDDSTLKTSLFKINNHTISFNKQGIIKIYSLDGKVVLSKENENIVNVDFLTVGYYIVEYNNERSIFLVN